MNTGIIGRFGELLVAGECVKRNFSLEYPCLTFGDNCDLVLNGRLRIEVKTSQLRDGRWFWGLSPKKIDYSHILVLVGLEGAKARYFILRTDMPFMTKRLHNRKSGLSMCPSHGFYAPISKVIERHEDNWSVLNEMLDPDAGPMVLEYLRGLVSKEGVHDDRD